MKYLFIPALILAYIGLLFVSLQYGSFLPWLVLFAVISIVFIVFKKARNLNITKRDKALIINFIGSPVLVTLFFFLAAILTSFFIKTPSGEPATLHGIVTFIAAGVLTFIVEKKLYDSMTKE